MRPYKQPKVSSLDGRGQIIEAQCRCIQASRRKGRRQVQFTSRVCREDSETLAAAMERRKYKKTGLVRESWSGVSGVSGVVSDAESGGRQEHQGILAEVHQQHSAESDHRGHRESIIAEQHRGQAGHTGRSSSKALRP